MSVVSFFLGVTPASEFYVPTFRNHLTTKNTTYERDGLKDCSGVDCRGEGGHTEPILVTGKVTVKVMFTLEQATKTQRGSRGMALLFP